MFLVIFDAKTQGSIIHDGTFPKTGGFALHFVSRIHKMRGHATCHFPRLVVAYKLVPVVKKTLFTVKSYDVCSNISEKPRNRDSDLAKRIARRLLVRLPPNFQEG